MPDGAVWTEQGPVRTIADGSIEPLIDADAVKLQVHQWMQGPPMVGGWWLLPMVGLGVAIWASIISLFF